MGISIGMVGVGSFGRVFVPLFKHHPLVERVALCDINRERLAACAKEFGVKETYESLDAICRTDLDALVIITQHWLHAPQAVQAMEAGKHVYSAVPVISLPDGNEMLDWCNRVVETSRRTGGITSGRDVVLSPRGDVLPARGGWRLAGSRRRVSSRHHSPECSLRIVWQMRWGSQWDMSKAGEPPMHYPTHSVWVPVCYAGRTRQDFSDGPRPGRLAHASHRIGQFIRQRAGHDASQQRRDGDHPRVPPHRHVDV
jgi:hypothetical protein